MLSKTSGDMIHYKMWTNSDIMPADGQDTKHMTEPTQNSHSNSGRGAAQKNPTADVKKGKV